MILLIELTAAAVISGLTALLFITASEKNLPSLEKFCRNKAAGLIISLPCALMCVPLAEPVAPAFLHFWLYPLAIAIPVLSYFYIDYYASRGWAFFLILLAYDIIHAAFERHIPLSGVLTVIALLWSLAGIWVSAKPCTLRDIFRKCAANKRWKYICGAASAVAAVSVIYTLIMVICGAAAK